MKNIEVRIDGIPEPDKNSNGNDLNGQAPADTNTGEQPLKEKVLDVLRDVYDPEIPVNIFDLGLIYNIDIEDDGKVKIKMTLTSPACPVAESLPAEIRSRISRISEVADCDLELVWDPPWGPDRMSDVAKLKLGLM